MDPKKVEIKNIGNKLVEENEENANKDMAKELENLNKITTTKEVQPIKIKEHDIELLKNELDITYEEAKNKLIKSQGDVNKAIEIFLNDFNLQ
jgi:NACalpha-BTF3-like transcription factor